MRDCHASAPFVHTRCGPGGTVRVQSGTRLPSSMSSGRGRCQRGTARPPGIRMDPPERGELDTGDAEDTAAGVAALAAAGSS
jgi:hypothetical protein